MRLLIGGVIVAAAMWSGYWWYGATHLKATVESWLDSRRNASVTASSSSISVRGFPNRFDMTLEDIEFADESEGWAWSMPWFQAFTLSYNPDHFVFAFPETQGIATASGEIRIDSDELMGSMVLGREGITKPLRTSLTARRMDLDATGRWACALLKPGIAVHLDEENPRVLKVAVEIDALSGVSGRNLTTCIGPSSEPALKGIRMEATVTLSEPAGSSLVAGSFETPVRIDLHRAAAAWGESDLAAAGSLEVDRAGVLSGEINISIRAWTAFLDQLAESGMLHEVAVPLVTRLLRPHAGDSRELEVVLEFSDGQTRLNSVPIAAAPRLWKN